MRKLLLATISIGVGLAVAPLALASPMVKPTTPTSISVTGNVNTVVDSNKSYTGQCNNGNPTVNCNIYTSKLYVFLNEAAASIAPDGVYFFVIGEPGFKADPTQESLGSTTNKNLSDNYDCYKNREVVISGGKIVKSLTSSDTSCFANGVPFAHVFDSPFVQAFPFADTSNNGGEYQAALCYVGQLDPSKPTTPVSLPGGSYKEDDLCAKSDNFKVLTSTPTPDTTPPTCSYYATVAGPPKQLQVEVQDSGSGLKSIVATTTNATVSSLAVTSGSTSPFMVTATKTNQAYGSTLKLTITDVAGNVTTCDPIMPGARIVKLVAGHAQQLVGLPSGLTTLTVKTGSAGGGVLIRVNGHVIRLSGLGAHSTRQVDIAHWMLQGRHNRIVVQKVGRSGRSTVVIA